VDGGATQARGRLPRLRRDHDRRPHATRAGRAPGPLPRHPLERDGLGFPVAWGLRIAEDADRIGALYETKRNLIQPSEFLLGPDRRVLHATYSSGPIGRIAADDVVKLVGFLEARAQART